MYPLTANIIGDFSVFIKLGQFVDAEREMSSLVLVIVMEA